MRGRPPLLVITVAVFVIGAGLLLVFDHALAIGLGVVLLLAFVVLGTFLIASPDYLAETPDDTRRPRRRRAERTF